MWLTICFTYSKIVFETVSLLGILLNLTPWLMFQRGTFYYLVFYDESMHKQGPSRLEITWKIFFLYVYFPFQLFYITSIPPFMNGWKWPHASLYCLKYMMIPTFTFHSHNKAAVAPANQLCARLQFKEVAFLGKCWYVFLSCAALISTF